MQRGLKGITSTLLLVALMCAVSRAEDAAPAPAPEPEPTLPAFQWSKGDLKLIEKIQAKVKPTEDMNFHEVQGREWRARSNISPRFTAELSLMVDRLQAAFSEIVPGKERHKAEPIVVVFGSLEHYQAVTERNDRAIFRYRWDWYKTWTEFHVYAGADGEEEHDFPRFERRHVLGSLGRGCLQRIIGQESDVPAWLNHGIKNFWSSWNVLESTRDNLADRWQRSPALDFVTRFVAAGADELPRLEQLLVQRDENWFDGGSEDWGRRDAMAESFVDFLLTTRPGKKTFSEAIENITSKSEGTPAIDPGEVPKLQSLWHQHLEQVVKSQKKK